ncbi:MAG: lysophospholipid acyltransferase family protein [Bacteroidota bacterium]
MNAYKPLPFYLKPFQWLYSIYAVVLFVCLLLILFPLVVIAASLGRVRGGNIINDLCRIWGNVWLPLIGIFHRNIYEAPIEKDKQYVFVANHISYMDIPVIFQGIRKKHFRILAKIEMSKIPVFGYLYRNATVMVDRGDMTKRTKSIMELRAFMKKDISIFIYPEGTFNETDQPLKSFYDGAFRLAIETQTPIKPIIFLDTLDRLHYKTVLGLTPGKSRAIILPDISVEGLEVKDIAALRDKAYKVMEDCILRYQ